MATASADIAVLCRKVRKEYQLEKGIGRKRPPPVVAVEDLDLSIDRGECYGLLGPNGAGKTTTMEILEGLLTPTSGLVRVLGRSWNQDEQHLRERVGVASQETRFPDRLSVEEILVLFTNFYRSARPVSRLLQELQLEDKRRARVATLSGGQRQRLAVACALAGDPELLFIDEPTTGLDPQSRRQLWDILAAFRAHGGTVLLTTHYMEEAERLCDRVAVIERGRIIRQGSPRALIAELGAEHMIDFELAGLPSPSALDESILRSLTSVTHARVGSSARNAAWTLTVSEPHRALPELMALVEGRGLALGRVVTRQGTLDDVFVSLTGKSLNNV